MYKKEDTLADYQPVAGNLKLLVTLSKANSDPWTRDGWAGRTAASAYNNIKSLEGFLSYMGLTDDYEEWKKRQE